MYHEGVKVNPNGLLPGDSVTFAVAGQFATMGRLRINGGAWMETTDTNEAGEYVWDYVIPSAGPYSVQAEVFQNGIWR